MKKPGPSKTDRLTLDRNTMETIHTDKGLREALYSVFLAQFNAVKACPGRLHHGDATRMLTGLMGSKPWSWQVVGITPAALDVFAGNEFRKPSRELQRGHIHSRSSTAEALFSPEDPMPLGEFFDFFLERDRTVIMLNSENPSRGSRPVPCYYPIDLSLGLFPCGSLIGWNQDEKEEQFLRSLHENRARMHRSCGWPRSKTCDICRNA